MRLRPLIVPFLVLASSAGAVAWLLLAEPPTRPETAQQGSNQRVATSAELPPAPGPDKDAAIVTSQSAAPSPNMLRDVSPEGVTPPPVDAPLTRVSPSEAYLESKNPPIEPVPPGPLEFRRVQVLDAGTLDTGETLVRIAHVVPLGLEDTCTAENGDTWPCGARARTSVRGLLRQLKVTCEKVEELGPREVSAICMRGRINLGEWLVRYGWATPADTAPDAYTELEQTAREKRVGQWQGEWRDQLSDPVTLESLADIPDLPDIIAEDGRSFLDENPVGLPEASPDSELNQDLSPLDGLRGIPGGGTTPSPGDPI